MSAATTVTTWDMYDTFSSTDQEETMDKPIAEKDDYPEAVVDSSRGTEKSVSMGSTTSTGKNEGHTQSLMLILHSFFSLVKLRYKFTLLMQTVLLIKNISNQQ